MYMHFELFDLFFFIKLIRILYSNYYNYNICKGFRPLSKQNWLAQIEIIMKI